MEEESDNSFALSLTKTLVEERLSTEAWLLSAGTGSARGFVSQPAYCVWPAGTGTADPS